MKIETKFEIKDRITVKTLNEKTGKIQEWDGEILEIGLDNELIIYNIFYQFPYSELQSEWVYEPRISLRD